jgi:hypothetical protein
MRGPAELYTASPGRGSAAGAERWQWADQTARTAAPKPAANTRGIRRFEQDKFKPSMDVKEAGRLGAIATNRKLLKKKRRKSGRGKVAAAFEKGVVMEKSDGIAVSARELLVALPILGTTLAITYDVGFFYGIDIGYFTLFSLAEHIVFALEAIPSAFVGALMVPMGIFSWQLGERALEKARGPITAETPAEERERIQARLDARQKRMDRWHLSFSVCVLALGILLFIISKELLFAPAAIVAGLYGLTGYVFPPKEYFRNPAYFAGTFYTIMFILTAFSLGLFSAFDRN